VTRRGTVFARYAARGLGLFIGLPLAILLAIDATTPDPWKAAPPARVEESPQVDVQPAGEADGRVVTLETLAVANGDNITVAINRPSDSLLRHTVRILIGGFDTGARSAGRVSDPGANVVVGYGYPDIGLLKDSNRSAILRLLAAQRDAHRIAAQIAELAGWVADRPWADRSRISLVGVSLGAVLAPVSARAMSAAGPGEPAVMGALIAVVRGWLVSVGAID
jgi:hypothetical protein